MVRRLRAATVLLLAALSSPAWADEDAVEEITVEPKTHATFGIGYGGPLGGAASIEILRGLGADVKEDSDRIKAIAGALLQLHAGTDGGKLSLGVGGHANIRTEDFKGTAAAALKLSLARTWHSPIDSGTEQTYLGPELEFSLMHVAVDLGVLFRLHGSGGHSTLFSWGVGVRVP
jgi:hypothetical protein